MQICTVHTRDKRATDGKWKVGSGLETVSVRFDFGLFRRLQRRTTSSPATEGRIMCTVQRTELNRAGILISICLLGSSPPLLGWNDKILSLFLILARGFWWGLLPLLLRLVVAYVKHGLIQSFSQYSYCVNKSKLFGSVWQLPFDIVWLEGLYYSWFLLSGTVESMCMSMCLMLCREYKNELCFEN